MQARKFRKSVTDSTVPSPPGTTSMLSDMFMASAAAISLVCWVGVCVWWVGVWGGCVGGGRERRIDQVLKRSETRFETNEVPEFV